MKVVWIADFCLKDWPQGGAELTDSALIQRGRELGHDIVWTRTNTLPLPEADLIITSNMHKADSTFIEHILQRKYVALFHDSKGEHFYEDVFEGAVALVFMSRTHRDLYASRHNTNGSKWADSFLQPAAFADVDRFYVGEKKEDVAVYCGLMAEHRGIYRLLEYAKDHTKTQFHLFGPVHSPKIERKLQKITKNPRKNVLYFGPRNPEDVPDILARAKYYIDLGLVGCFGRGVIEGYLSGCSLIVNDAIGALSYDWPWYAREEVREILREAPTRFWRELDERM
jgi:hypothetical protein